MTDQPLLDFIKNQLQLGLTKEAIMQMLLGEGWTTADISEAFNAVLNPAPVSAPAPDVVPTPSSQAFVTPAFTVMPDIMKMAPLQQSKQDKPRTPRKGNFILPLIIVALLCIIGVMLFVLYKR